ncbi:hypothetical protein [Chryseobacterium indoltheticum]|uniref:Uncharacterized protein n=1 Tax=Chryseobacterium indoltheticum TaxID=254 RepID=A0A381FG96_9FLAO|nr:hypothetical protein [Chryseobacterium indoltheticum]AZA74545.1 hypothetical protein EG358_12580 [Chryseobacterium indoltheticum]SIQ08477.1 hypothetical protein SAMN05421682_102290 [Chryseobacterium indoltheticum]SUX45560.1 Uncharacterised protein [Chryseobacterium indoltheticum]
MYQIAPYDLSKSFKFIPEKKKYCLLFELGNTVEFTSKRKAFDFIAKLSHLFVETLAISEMVNNTISSFSFHIKPLRKSNNDLYNIYHNNSADIFELIRDLKFYQNVKIELYQIVMRFNRLINLIVQNCKILNKKNYNCVVPYQLIIEKSAKCLWKIIENAAYHYENKKLTLFLL